ncbi:Uncharacterised protein [Mycobacteroides abscessus subsp. abscessus]|nr:Uncharacterised protein [Mycobacteroides abscessus subsp. abscessus]
MISKHLLFIPWNPFKEGRRRFPVRTLVQFLQPFLPDHKIIGIRTISINDLAINTDNCSHIMDRLHAAFNLEAVDAQFNHARYGFYQLQILRAHGKRCILFLE